MSGKIFTHIDCFAGPGGICTGLHASGFRTLAAIEYIQSCCDTYAANHKEVKVICSDIRKVISADQSWKKSSGHAFEEMVKTLATDSLCP